MKIAKIMQLSKSFLKMAEEANFCQIDLSNYSEALWSSLMELSESSKKQFQLAQSTPLQEIIDQLKSAGADDPILFQALREKDGDQIFSKLKNLPLPASLKIKAQAYADLQEDYYYSEADAEEDRLKISKATYSKMEKISQHISQAIKRINNYKGHNWLIQPFSGDLSQPTSGANIISARYPQVNFTIHLEGDKTAIDDVIDEPEDLREEIPDDWQQDYYLLINELRNPGSTSRGKILRLYSARPKMDRSFYQTTEILPNGVYLTNREDSAQGLATDLSAGEPRDVWMFLINSKHLLQTLNGREKHYRVLEQNGAPIIDRAFLG